jgi:hypothetical protein
MKRVLCTVAMLLIAAPALAGSTSKADDMTPQQAWEKMTNCPVCSVWMTEPALGPTIRHSVNATNAGYVETLMTADEKMVPAFQKTAAECEKRAAGIASMTPEQKDKLCPICVGQVKLMGRSDVTFEHFMTPLGMMTVATSSSTEGKKALHDYAAASKSFGDKMAKAGADMSKEPMKSKM